MLRTRPAPPGHNAHALLNDVPAPGSFAFVTKKGVNTLLPRLKEMDFHFAVTIEGRDDSQLPEQIIAAAGATKLDFKGASEVQLG